MKDLKSIDIILENCEVIKIDGNDIGDFYLGKIETEIARLAVNSIAEYQIANKVMIELFKRADVNYNPFGMEETESVFNRLTTWHDITGIDVNYEDGDVKGFLVSYDEGKDEGKLGAPNINEDTYVSELGHLYIVISKEKEKVSDLFDIETINNKDIINYKERMYRSHE